MIISTKTIYIIALFFLALLLNSCSSDENTSNQLDSQEQINEDQIREEDTSGEEPEEVQEQEEEQQQEEEEEEHEERENIVWKNWYLSVPLEKSDASGKATSIYYEDIINDQLTAPQREYFYKNEDGSYTMYTKFTGFTTSGFSETAPNGGTKFCRTELREYWKGNQDATDNWYMDTGTHEMESTLKVNYCGGSNQTYVAQIHARSSPTKPGSAATVKVLWKNGDLVIEYYIKPDNGIWTSDYIEKITIATVDYEKFTIKLRIIDGTLEYALTCEAKSIVQPYQELYDYVSNGYDFDNYFKTGNYFKWNSDYTESAEVILYEVKTNHY
ncbi:polysaccharide lyase family 7 protein [Aquimarina pacifica]|uniref:polysaccharide lyase family 7 protein n=1 Tax=Aquimarina pacifica TaxID=1296415 RepID=UPI00046F1837|nr:polysaccharide lyase family 7 protein [Aquimarina pacifica]